MDIIIGNRDKIFLQLRNQVISKSFLARHAGILFSHEERFQFEDSS